MKFETSHGFIQGSTHLVCEDYAISSHVTGMDLTVPFTPLIIVTDGCSAADNTDVGARIVAFAARRVLTALVAALRVVEPPALASEIIQQIDHAVTVLGIRREWCVATLLAGFVVNGVCHVYGFGDGVWYRRSKSGELSYTVIEAIDQKPPYLISGPEKCQVTLAEYPSGDRTDARERWFHWSFAADTVSEFGIATDGVCAVKLRQTTSVLEALTGDRVEYLVNNFLETHPYLYDDIGIAAIRVHSGKKEPAGD